MEQRPKKLLEQVRDAIRLKHYSYQTEKTYVRWIKRYIFFHIISSIPKIWEVRESKLF